MRPFVYKNRATPCNERSGGPMAVVVDFHGMIDYAGAAR
jgi:hypothetical protein